MFQFDNAGAEDFPEPTGVALVIDIMAILGFGAFALFAMIGVAVVLMSFGS